jgi:hypothetical protein
MHSVLLSILLLAQGLMFSDQTWSFNGEVVEIRQVLVMGLPSQIALVQSSDFEAWVILNMTAQSDELPEVILGKAGIGDLVRVSISGPHVSENGVDWDLCQPIYSNYCRQGGLYDTGLIATDWGLPLSPSNEFIHHGNSNPSLEYPLFWNTEKLAGYDKTVPSIYRSPGSQGGGALRSASIQAVSAAHPLRPACLSRLAESAVGRVCGSCQPGCNLPMAAFPASRVCAH